MDDASDERWLAVPGYEGIYEVSDLGRVRSIPRIDNLGRHWRGLILRPAPQARTGYLGVRLSRSGVTSTHAIHRLVMLAFIGPPPPGQEVCHGPNGRLDNRLSELSYGTHAKNSGPDKARDGTLARGSDAPGAKLSEADVREIRRRHAAGELHREIAKDFPVGKGAISAAVSGRDWGHLPGAAGTGRRMELQARGVDAGGVKLTQAQVLAIRAEHASGESRARLAAAFGISLSNVRRIVRGETWTHLPSGGSR